MKYQASQHNFEFVGIDIIVDQSGQCWLLEANRLPGLESSNNNKDVEDCMYDEMMRLLLDIVLKPLSVEADSYAPSFKNEGLDETHPPRWQQVREASSSRDNYSIDTPSWKNLFSWKAFTRKLRPDMMVSFQEHQANVFDRRADL